MPTLPNDEKSELAWRKVMQEPLPLYFNKDGTRVDREGFDKRSMSRQQSRERVRSIETIQDQSRMNSIVEQQFSERQSQPTEAVNRSQNDAILERSSHPVQVV